MLTHSRAKNPGKNLAQIYISVVITDYQLLQQITDIATDWPKYQQVHGLI